MEQCGLWPTHTAHDLYAVQKEKCIYNFNVCFDIFLSLSINIAIIRVRDKWINFSHGEPKFVRDGGEFVVNKPSKNVRSSVDKSREVGLCSRN